MFEFLKNDGNLDFDARRMSVTVDFFRILKFLWVAVVLLSVTAKFHSISSSLRFFVNIRIFGFFHLAGCILRNRKKLRGAAKNLTIYSISEFLTEFQGFRGVLIVTTFFPIEKR